MGHISKHEYAKLMVENRQKFYRIAYSYVKNEADALDIVSEATYKGLVHIKDLRNNGYFKTWMTRIVINTALDSVRKSARSTVLCDYIIGQTDGNPVELEREIQFDLYHALDALGAEEKTCIILKYFEEYSFGDIAALLEMPESTVKSRVYRCLKIMKAYMEGGGQPC